MRIRQINYAIVSLGLVLALHGNNAAEAGLRHSSRFRSTDDRNVKRLGGGSTSAADQYERYLEKVRHRRELRREAAKHREAAQRAAEANAATTQAAAQAATQVQRVTVVTPTSTSTVSPPTTAPSTPRRHGPYESYGDAYRAERALKRKFAAELKAANAAADEAGETKADIIMKSYAISSQRVSGTTFYFIQETIRKD